MSRAAAGPICGRVLADLGAEVVRVEDPAGEHSRQVGLTFAANNRNKLSLGVDLTRPEGLDLLARLTEKSDVVLTNALPEASARLGIDPAAVQARNPSACHISILGFGRRPPFGGRRVVDAAAQALSGQALAEGGGQEPVGCTGGFLDNGTGWLAALGCVATLYQRQTAGHAGTVEAALLNTSAFIQLFSLADPPLTGRPAGHRPLGLCGRPAAVPAAGRLDLRGRDQSRGPAGVRHRTGPGAGAEPGRSGAGGHRVRAGPGGDERGRGRRPVRPGRVRATGPWCGRWRRPPAAGRTLSRSRRSHGGTCCSRGCCPATTVTSGRRSPGRLGRPGRDDAEVLRRYGLAGQHEALLASGAIRREPGPTALQASSV